MTTNDPLVSWSATAIASSIHPDSVPSSKRHGVSPVPE
jgi:hypothetical protein